MNGFYSNSLFLLLPCSELPERDRRNTGKLRLKTRPGRSCIENMVDKGRKLAEEYRRRLKRLHIPALHIPAANSIIKKYVPIYNSIQSSELQLPHLNPIFEYRTIEMNFKTILIVIISVLVTVVLMNNTDEVDFWLFGDARIPKLAILGTMFGLGLIVGFVLGRPRRKIVEEIGYKDENVTRSNSDARQSTLTEEDRDYINE